MRHNVQSFCFDSSHCLCQNVTGNCLRCVLDQPTRVGFLSAPFVVLSHTFVGQAHTTEAIRLFSRFQIGKPSARRKHHPESAGVELKGDLANLLPFPGLESLHRSFLYIPPVLDNLRVGLPPGINDLRQLFLMQSHLQSTHADECSGGATISTSQSCNLPFLAKITIDTVLDDRHMEHLGSGRAVEVLAVLECVQHPLFLCLPCQHAGFNSGKVCHDELASIFRNQHGADELGQDIRRISVDALQHVKAAHFHQLSRLIQCGNMVLRQILQLNIPAGVPSGAAGTIELKQSSGSAIRTHTAFRCLILLDGAFRHLEPELQHIHRFFIYPVLVQLADHLCDILLTQSVHRDTTLVQPSLKLGHRVRILQPGQFVSFLAHGIRQEQVAGNSLLHQLCVDLHATVVDAFIYPVVMPLPVRHREAFQPFVDINFCVDILDAVVLELRPLLRQMMRKIACAAAVFLGRSARHRKQFDELFAFFILLLRGSQHLADIFQSHRQGQRCRHDHRADPLVRRQECAGFQILSGIVLLEIPGKTHTLESRVMSDQGHVAILEIVQKFLRKRLSRCKVCQPCFAKAAALICCPGNQENLETGVGGITVQSAFLDVCLTVGLNID